MITPISPWLCLRCGNSERYGVVAPPCCPEQFSIRVMLEEPDPVPPNDDDDLGAEFVCDLGLEAVEC